DPAMPDVRHVGVVQPCLVLHCEGQDALPRAPCCNHLQLSMRAVAAGAAVSIIEAAHGPRARPATARPPPGRRAPCCAAGHVPCWRDRTTPPACAYAPD